MDQGKWHYNLWSSRHKVWKLAFQVSHNNKNYVPHLKKEQSIIHINLTFFPLMDIH